MRGSFQSTASQPDAHARLKEGQRRLWSLGDYGEIAHRLQPYADALSDPCGIARGDHVLDVGAGTGERFDYLEVLARTSPSRPMSSAGST